MRVIVTGASKGIGRGIASFLAMDGFDVGLLARSKDELEDLRQSLEEQDGTCYSVACDVRDRDQVSYAIAALVEGLGGVDALINNAGLVIRKSVFDISMDEWDALIDTNVNGLFYVTRAVLPYMKAQGKGHIINVSSISGKVPLPGGSAYAASKFAVTGFSQSIFQELRDYGIAVTTVYPGSVDSASHRHDHADDHSWKVQPEEVGQVCRDILHMRHGAVVSEVEVRPLGRPPKK
jgi:3-oxoacyl-[acyl-carrier protein] reductase